MNIPTGEQQIDYSFSPDDVGFPMVTGPTLDVLQKHGPRHKQEYRDFKTDYIGWFYNVGKKPNKQEGYSERTCEQICYKTDQMFRWMWKIERDYSTELTPAKADELMEAVERGDWGASNVLTFKKTVKRYFKWHDFTGSSDWAEEWECPIEVSEKQRTERDYFRPHEFPELYRATLDYGAVKNYGECTPEERDEFKAVLAQRFEMPKEEVSREEFKKANSWKFPSMMAVVLDTGLRPIEVGRMKTDWVNLSDKTLDIPPKEATKSDNNWKCALSKKTVRALSRWLNEREAYEKYEGSDLVWLNRIGNAYNSKSLNHFLDNVLEKADIDPMGRDLTWYSIRHGVASLWANTYGIQHAQEQLRHEKIETTMRYVHSDSNERNAMADEAW